MSKRINYLMDKHFNITDNGFFFTYPLKYSVTQYRLL